MTFSNIRLFCLHWKCVCFYFFYVATFINCLRWIFRINYYHFYISTWCFTLHLMLWRWLLSLHLMHQPVLSSNFPSAASLLVWVLNEYKRVRNLLWLRPWFKGMLRLVWSFVLATTPFFIWAVRLFDFLIIHVLTAAADLISIRKFSFALTLGSLFVCA